MSGYKPLLVAAVAAVTSLSLPAIGHATTYDLEYNCGSSGCTNVGILGTVDITGGGTSITYDFKTIDPSTLWNSGLTTLLFDVTGTVTGHSITDSASGLTWTFESPAANADGLSSGTWLGYNCGTNPPNHDCGTEAIVTLTGTGLAAAFNTIQGLNFFAGADIQNNAGFTGMVGAVAAAPLPGAAALFGSVLFGGLGLSAWRKRRSGRRAISVLA